MSADLTDRYRDVERALACCVLAHGKPEVVHAVKPEQIADPTAKAIVTAAAALLESGRRPDAVSVALVLAPRHRDWPSRVAEIHAHEGVVFTNWRHYAADVREGAYLRRAAAAAQRILEAAESGHATVVADALADATEVAP